MQSKSYPSADRMQRQQSYINFPANSPSTVGQRTRWSSSFSTTVAFPPPPISKSGAFPAHAVVKKRFGITLQEWLKRDYPVTKPSAKEKRTKAIVIRGMVHEVRVELTSP